MQPARRQLDRLPISVAAAVIETLGAIASDRVASASRCASSWRAIGLLVVARTGSSTAPTTRRAPPWSSQSRTARMSTGRVDGDASHLSLCDG
jgi:hypothetical protein